MMPELEIVVRVARRRARSGLELADLIGIGRQAMADWEMAWLDYLGSAGFEGWAEARVDAVVDEYFASISPVVDQLRGL